MARRLGGHTLGRQFTQLVIYQRQQLPGRTGISSRSGIEDPGDIGTRHKG